jgi:hypothetical protein
MSTNSDSGQVNFGAVAGRPAKISVGTEIPFSPDIPFSTTLQVRDMCLCLLVLTGKGREVLASAVPIWTATHAEIETEHEGAANGSDTNRLRRDLGVLSGNSSCPRTRLSSLRATLED